MCKWGNSQISVKFLGYLSMTIYTKKSAKSEFSYLNIRIFVSFSLNILFFLRITSNTNDSDHRNIEKNINILNIEKFSGHGKLTYEPSKNLIVCGTYG